MFVCGVFANLQKSEFGFLILGPQVISEQWREAWPLFISQLLQVPPLITSYVHILLNKSLTSVFLDNSAL